MVPPRAGSRQDNNNDESSDAQHSTSSLEKLLGADIDPVTFARLLERLRALSSELVADGGRNRINILRLSLRFD